MASYWNLKRSLVAAFFLALALVQLEWMFEVPSSWMEGPVLRVLCKRKDHARACYAWAKREDISRDLINETRLAPEAAFAGYRRGCDLGNMHACTDLSSWYIRKEKFHDAIDAAKKACDQKDAIGCYNVACGYCRLQNKEKTLEYLRMTQELNGEMLGEAEAWKDPDLVCLKDNQDFEKLISRFSR